MCACESVGMCEQNKSVVHFNEVSCNIYGAAAGVKKFKKIYQTIRCYFKKIN